MQTPEHLYVRKQNTSQICQFFKIFIESFLFDGKHKKKWNEIRTTLRFI